jgi:hypothetical protein
MRASASTVVGEASFVAGEAHGTAPKMWRSKADVEGIPAERPPPKTSIQPLIS